jgi:hypothetical protein
LPRIFLWSIGIIGRTGVFFCFFICDVGFMKFGVICTYSMFGETCFYQWCP